MSTNHLQKKLWWIIGILIGLNILMPISYFLLRPVPPNRMHHPPPFHFLEKELDFDEAQMKQYRQLRDNHRQKTKDIHRRMRQLKSSFFGQIKSGTPSDSLLILIGEQQQDLDRLTFLHFSTIRENICTEAQKPHFDQVIQKVFSQARGPKHRPPN